MAGGCGGDETGNDGGGGESAADQIRPAPEGYRYTEEPDAAAGFEQRVREDLGADDVAVRSVYREDELVAGLVVAHVADPPPAEEIAAAALSGPRTDLTEVEAGAGSAQLASERDAGSVAVIDTFGEYVLIVVADSGPDAIEAAAPNVR
jgi:hypothetical protein